MIASETPATQTIIHTLAALADALLKAQLAAIQRLAKLVESSDNPAESRRAAATILRFRLPQAEHLPARPDPSPASPSREPAPTPPGDSRAANYHHHTTPLIPEELDLLAALFPDQPRSRFTSRRDPSFWRFQIVKRNNFRPPAFADKLCAPRAPT